MADIGEKGGFRPVGLLGQFQGLQAFGFRLDAGTDVADDGDESDDIAVLGAQG